MKGLLLNRYHIKRKIGEGGMGEVFLARDTYWGDITVAIKTIKNRVMKNRSMDMLLRFKKEYEIMTLLYHPNLVRVRTLEYDSREDNYYIVMEYIEGRTLKEYLDKGELSVPEAVDIMVPLLRAVEFIHSRNIIYRDIKPHNIIMSRDGLKLTDFGLSNLYSSEDRIVRGTLNYLAPEITRNRYDFRADIYSLGVLFCEMLTGKIIINSDRVSDFISALGDEKIYEGFRDKALEAVGDPEIMDIVCKMTSFCVDKRYDSCMQIITDINRATGRKYSYETRETMQAYICHSGFINRKREFRVLRDRVLKPSENGRFLLLTGNTGFGKRRLLYEFKKYCQMNEAEFYDSDCLQTVRSPYYPVGQIISQMLFRSDPSLLKTWGRYLAMIIPHNRMLEEFYLQREDRYNKDTLHYGITNFILDYSEKSRLPVILSINNLQWCDENSLEIIEGLISTARNRKENCRIQVFGCMAEDESSDINLFINRLSAGGLLSKLALKEFTSDDIGEYIAGVFGKNSLSPSIQKSMPKIKNAVNGNPLILREFLGKLVNDGYIQRKDSKWVLTRDIDEIDLPEKVSEIISIRISSLSLDEGENTMLSMLALIEIGMDIDDISRLGRGFFSKNTAVFLEKLEKHEIVTPYRKENRILFAVTHRLIRDVVKKGISDEAGLHARIAKKFEAMFKTRIEDFYEILAMHYMKAGKRARALNYILRSGVKAFRRHDNAAALGWFDKGLAMRGKRYENAIILLMLRKASVLYFTGRTQEAEELARDALMRSEALGSEELGIESKMIIATVKSRYGEIKESIRLLEEGLKYYEPRGMKSKIVSAYATLGMNYHFLSDSQKALEYFRKQRDICLDSGNMTGYAIALGNIGNVYIKENMLQEAVEAHLKSGDIYRNEGDKRGLAVAYGNLGIAYFRMGDYSRALDTYALQREACSEIGNNLGYSYCLINSANVYSAMGEYDEALDCYGKSRAILARIGDQRGYGISLLNSAGIKLRQRDFISCLHHLKEAIGVLKQIEYKHGYLEALYIGAQVSMITGEIHEALDYIKRGIEISVDLGHEATAAKFCCAEAWLCFPADKKRSLASCNNAFSLAEECSLENIQKLSRILHIKILNPHQDDSVRELDNIARGSDSSGVKICAYYELYILTHDRNYQKKVHDLVIDLPGYENIVCISDVIDEIRANAIFG